MNNKGQLTKAERALAKRFLQQHITGMAVNMAVPEGDEITATEAMSIAEIVNLHNIDSLTESVGTALFSHVDYKILSRVEKFLSDPENISAMEVCRHVSEAVGETLLDVVKDILATAEEQS